MAWYNEPKTISAYAGLVASVAALMVSVSAIRKKPDDTTAHSMYKVLVEAVERLSDESEQNRADLIRLRKYIEEYNNSRDQNISISGIVIPSAIPPRIDPPVAPVQVYPPRIVASTAPVMASSGHSMGSASSVSSTVPYNVTIGNSKQRPPVDLKREWNQAAAK